MKKVINHLVFNNKIFFSTTKQALTTKPRFDTLLLMMKPLNKDANELWQLANQHIDKSHSGWHHLYHLHLLSLIKQNNLPKIVDCYHDYYQWCKHHSNDTLQNLYVSLIKFLTNLAKREPVKSSQDHVEFLFNFKPSEIKLEAVLKYLLQIPATPTFGYHLDKILISLLKHLLDRNIKPNAELLNSVVCYVFANAKSLHQTRELAQKVQFTSSLFNVILNRLIRQGNLSRALGLFERIHQIDPWLVDDDSFHILLTACGREKLVTNCHYYYSLWVSHRPLLYKDDQRLKKGDINGYVILKSIWLMGEYDKGWELLEKQRTSSRFIRFCNAALFSCLFNEDYHQFHNVYQAMERWNVSDNVYTKELLINYELKQGTLQQVQKLLHELSMMDDVPRNVLGRTVGKINQPILYSSLIPLARIIKARGYPMRQRDYERICWAFLKMNLMDELVDWISSRRIVKTFLVNRAMIQLYEQHQYDKICKLFEYLKNVPIVCQGKSDRALCYGPNSKTMAIMVQTVHQMTKNGISSKSQGWDQIQALQQYQREAKIHQSSSLVESLLSYYGSTSYPMQDGYQKACLLYKDYCRFLKDEFCPDSKSEQEEARKREHLLLLKKYGGSEGEPNIFVKEKMTRIELLNTNHSLNI